MIVAYSFMRPIGIFCTNKQAEYGSFISARGLRFMDIRLVDAICIHYTLSVVIIEDKRPIAIYCNWVSLCIHGYLKCEIDFELYSKQS